MKKTILSICFIAYIIPVFGQIDTLTEEGLNLKYENQIYGIPNNGTSVMTMEKIRNKDFSYDGPSYRIIGELDSISNRMGLTYKTPPQYLISESFGLKEPPTNPEELLRTTDRLISSKWIHEDGECILFIKSHLLGLGIDRLIDEYPDRGFMLIGGTLKIPRSFRVTEEEKKNIRKKITFWTPEKSKEIFNAQYVITYPIKEKKSVYMDKYTHKRDLILVKWGQGITISFLVTKKGNRNIQKYIKDVEEAFRFID